MKLGTFSLGALVGAAALTSAPQETPEPMAACYSALADGILAIKQTEAEFVRSMLDTHSRAATAAMERKDYERAAAEMALFANEGDNAIGGVRKRLIEGGHHHNAEGEAKGIYDAGFVIVTREAKQKVLAAAIAMRAAGDDDARMQAWRTFGDVVKGLMQRK